MIQDNQCNRVYFSALLPKTCPVAFRGLTEVLDRYQVPWSLLERTNNIWCRDYMPIQILPNRFVSYKYWPDYLLKYESVKATISDGKAVCKSLGYICEDILDGYVIDGGNTVKADGKVIMTSKLFEENPEAELSYFTRTIQSAFGARLIVLPWDANEEFGHTDGICRYIGGDSVLMTNYSQIDEKMAVRFHNALAPHFCKVEELVFRSAKPHKYSWAYINWLQTEQVLILPKFGIPEDEQAFEQISAMMPDYVGRIEMVDANDIVKFGGAFNCCSWTIRDEKLDELPF